MKVSTAINGLTLLAGYVSAASLTQVTNFGTNPTNTGMFVYLPDKKITKPPLIVGIHWCSGTAQAFYSGTRYATLAETYGYVVIYPNAPDPGGCWDVHTAATLTHNSGGDSLGIASMVRYAIANYGVDATRVFMTGVSSGAMMTNVLAGAYPDLFAAGAAFAGVPYSCFSGPDAWNSACSTGTISKTPQQWGDLVRAGYPGYTGKRPKMQLWHGTEDNVLYYQNFGEEVKQWTNVFGVSQTPTATTSNSPLSGWTRSQYGPNVQAISAQGVPHNIAVQETDVLAWFGITTAGTPVSSTPSTPTATPTGVSSTPSTATPTSTPTGALVPKYGQCGGIGWTGGTVCVAGSTCQKSNDWYSQCL